MMYNDYDKHDFAAYGGYLDDDEKLLQSASGGIATALSEYMLQQGGYVVGVAYSEDFYSAEYIIVDNPSDLHKLKGSKYIECNKKNVYSDVKKLLDAGEKVLFFGLPCIVGALYSYLKSRPNNLLTCELICHGPTFPKVHSDYVAYLERKYKSKVVDFSVRHKVGAWKPLYTPPTLRAKFENGKVFQKPFPETEYAIAFTLLSKEACYQCKFKGNNRQADIMLGDFWGATKTDAFWNEHGISAILAETEKGDAFLKSTPNITLFPTTFDRIVDGNPVVIRSRPRSNKRDKLAALLSEKGLMYAVKHSMDYHKRIANVVLKVIPYKLQPIVKGTIKKLFVK